MAAPVTDAELQADLDAYRQCGGNRSAAARLRQLPRNTYRDRLALAEKRFGVQLGKVVDGRVDYVKARRLPLPKGDGVARYFLTAAQNNTHPHPGLANVRAYVDWLNRRRGDSCRLMVGTFTYALDAYGEKAVKRGTWRPDGKLWYDPQLEPFICDESVELAPGLVWCGEMNILPTAANPLVSLDDYNGRKSNIVPHAKIAMESIPSFPDEPTKFNYSTGAITQRNYIQKRAGILAERKHSYGGVLVEVDSAGNWFVRQIELGADGELYDIGPRGYRAVRVAGGKVETIRANAAPSASWLEAITWGDIHASEMDVWIRALGWHRGGMLDVLAPRRQFFHDLFSMRSRSHHEWKNFHRHFEKWVNDEGGVEAEVQVTADFVNEADRPWCESYVVRSNHDRHLDRWLNEGRVDWDPENAVYFALLQHQKLAAIESGNEDFNVLEWALRRAGVPDGLRFLGEDESFVICKGANSPGIECGMHGDLGPSGARGSTRNLRRMGRPANKAHDHRATWMDGVISVGACSLNMPYMRGPSAASASHAITWRNGARSVLTMWAGKYRA
ncbi:hypothetical protein ACJMQP_04220 [Rhodopseudomonas palustris]